MAGPSDEHWDAALDASAGLIGGGDELLGRLERWAADAWVDEAARQRSRERWLRQQAEAGASIAGVLLDLAERHVPVSLHTRAARRHHGLIAGVGADFCALAPVGRRLVLIALQAVGVVRTQPRVDPTLGDRPVQLELRLSDVLAELAGDRARVLLVMIDGADAVAGELRAVGQDVCTLLVDGDRRATAYVRIDAIAEVALA